MAQSHNETQTAAEAHLERLQEGLRNDLLPGVSDDDQQTLIAFDNEIKTINAAENRFGPDYHGELIWYMQQYAVEVGGITATLEDSEDGEAAVNRLLKWLDDKDLADSTKAGALSAIRVFGDVMLEQTSPGEFDEDELPERFRKIQPEKHITERNPAPLPSNVLDWADAIKMAQSRRHARDKAMILSQLGCGLRPMAELHKLKFKHVEDNGDHFIISTPAGAKTGRREVRLYAGSAMFRKWLTEDHPAHLESEPGPGPETYVWTHLNENKPIVYETLANVFRTAGEDAAIEKSHSPQHFRRSCASYAASKHTIGERELRQQFGWSAHSAAPEHYITTFSDRVSIHFAEAYGHEVEDLEGEKLAPIVCASCEKWTTRHFDTCIWCTHEIDEDLRDIQHVVTDPDAPDKDLLDMIVDGDVGADDLRSVQQLEGVIQTEPEFFDRLEQLITLAEGYEAEQSDAANSVLDPIGLGAYASRAATEWARAKDRLLRASPAFEDYPPDRSTAAKVGASWALLAAVAVVVLAQNGTPDALAAGDPVHWAGLLTGTALGGVLLDRLLPTYEETVGRLLEEMQVDVEGYQ